MGSEWLSINAATALLIEENPDVKPPFHYDFHFGGTTLSQLERCVESCFKLAESSIAASESDRRAARRRLDHAEFVLKQARQIEDDLYQEAYLAQSEKPSALHWHPNSWQEGEYARVCKRSLIQWAHETQHIDVGGFHARRQGKTPPLEPKYTDTISTRDRSAAIARVTRSPNQIWREIIEAGDRKKLFSANHCLLHIYLDAAIPNWTQDAQRQGLTTVPELYKAGVLNQTGIAEQICIETNLSEKSVGKFVNRLLENHLELADAAVFTHRETKSGHKLLFGLAFAAARATQAITAADDRAPLRRDHKLVLKRLKKHVPEESISVMDECMKAAWTTVNRQ